MSQREPEPPQDEYDVPRGAPQGGGATAAGHERPPEEYLEPVQLVKVRRSPNFVRFMLTGGVVGLVVGFVADQLGGRSAGYGEVSSFLFFGLGCAALGVLFAALLAVLLDRRT